MIATPLAAAVLMMTAPPPDSTPVPPEETALAELTFVDTVANEMDAAPEFVACESERVTTAATGDSAEQPSVMTQCYGTVAGTVIWASIIHVGEEMNVTWAPYRADGPPHTVSTLSAPPVMVDAAADMTDLTAVTAAATTASAEPSAEFGDGTFVVGTDILPGTYRSEVLAGETCYWERVSGSNAPSDGGLSNALIVVPGETFVDIAPTDLAFFSVHCGTWTRVE